MFGMKPKRKLFVEHKFLYTVSSGRKLMVSAVLNTETSDINVHFPNADQKRYFLEKDKAGLDKELIRIFTQLGPTKPEKRSLASRLGFGAPPQVGDSPSELAPPETPSQD